VGVLWVSGSPSRADLIAHWTLDETDTAAEPAGIEDSGPSAFHHGTAVVPAESPVVFEVEGAPSETDTAAEFRGGAIHVPYDPELNPESFTFCAWARLDAIAQHQSVVTSRHDAAPGLAGYILYADPAGNWSFWTGRPGAWDPLVGGPVSPGVWTHLAISFDADTSTKTIWIDGVPTTDGSQQYTPNALRDLHIGAGGDLGTQYPFGGSIDDAALWDIALGEDEVLQVLDEGAISVPDGIVAHWPLDEPAGTTGTGWGEDATGNGHDGSPPAPPWTVGEPGANEETGTSILFQGASVDVPYDAELNPASFTVTAWVRPTQTAGYQSVITSRQDVNAGAETQGYILYNDAAGNWAFWTGQGPGLLWGNLAGPPVAVDVWQHVAITFDSETNAKRLYVDAIEVAATDLDGYAPNMARDLHIGAGADLGDQFRFAGNIDDVGLWDEELAEDEIRDVMENGIDSEPQPEGLGFLRGDCNGDGNVIGQVGDAIFVLNFNFTGGPVPSCMAACDSNGDGNVIGQVGDAIYTLNFNFTGGPAIPAPFPECARSTDPADSALGCEVETCP